MARQNRQAMNDFKSLYPKSSNYNGLKKMQDRL